MNILNKITLVTMLVGLVGCAGQTRIVYEDHYFPVPYGVKLSVCPEPTYIVGTLSPDKVANDGVYVQSHIADDRRLQGYAECNKTVIQLFNEAVVEQNKKTLKDMPPEVLEKLPADVKQAIIENQ